MKKDFLTKDWTHGQTNALVKNLGEDVARRIIAGEKFTLNFSNEINVNLAELQIFWKNLYKKYFNLDIDPSIIQEREGKWAIFIAKGLTIQQVYDALPFPKRKYADGNLDIAVQTNDRTSKNDYVIYVDQNIEADEQFKNKSAEDLKQMNHTGITFLERLLLELYYFEETGNHLDVTNITLCSGSRYSGGGVPYVYWSGVTLRVGWSRSSSASSLLRSREVVSA